MSTHISCRVTFPEVLELVVPGKDPLLSLDQVTIEQQGGCKLGNELKKNFLIEEAVPTSYLSLKELWGLDSHHLIMSTDPSVGSQSYIPPIFQI